MSSYSSLTTLIEIPSWSVTTYCEYVVDDLHSTFHHLAEDVLLSS